MTLQERLRFIELKQGGMRIQDHNELIREAADALNARDARIAELEGALRDLERKAGELVENADVDPPDFGQHLEFARIRALEALKRA